MLKTNIFLNFDLFCPKIGKFFMKIDKIYVAFEKWLSNLDDFEGQKGAKIVFLCLLCKLWPNLQSTKHEGLLSLQDGSQSSIINSQHPQPTTPHPQHFFWPQNISDQLFILTKTDKILSGFNIFWAQNWFWIHKIRDSDWDILPTCFLNN